MLFSDVDTIQPERLTPGEPIALVQRTSRMTLAGLALASATAVALLLVPFWLIAARLIVEPTVVTDITTEPVALLQLGLALLVALTFAGMALRQLIRLAGRRREVFIEAGVVSVVDRHFGRQRRWQQPVAAYCGLARSVRSSTAGVRHLIVLVHPDARRHVVLVISSSPEHETFAALSERFGLPEVSDRLVSATARMEVVERTLSPVATGRLAA